MSCSEDSMESASSSESLPKCDLPSSHLAVSAPYWNVFVEVEVGPWECRRQSTFSSVINQSCPLQAEMGQAHPTRSSPW